MRATEFITEHEMVFSRSGNKLTVQKAYKPPKTSLKGTVGTKKTVKPRK